MPSIEKAEGSYPTMIKQNSGRNVPVVQAYAFGKYLGNLQVVFNDHDEVVAAFGEPILLNRNIPQGNHGRHPCGDFLNNKKDFWKNRAG